MAAWLSAGRNPYVAGKALGSDRGFFGRDDILRLVQEVFSSDNQSSIVLSGQRRIGKTSILLQLQRRLPRDRFCAVYFDLMDRAEEPLAVVLTRISLALAAESGTKIPDIACDDEGATFQNQFLSQLYAALGPKRRPVLLLDEFDVLDSAAQRRLDSRSAALRFFPYLRRLMEQDDRLGFVFVVGRKPDELSIQFKAAFKAALFKRVSVLESDDARQLILTAEREGTLKFQPAAVERILALTTGHPLFTQLMCQILWDSSHSKSPTVLPEVSVAAVDGVVERALEAGEHIFQWIWDGLPPAERIISAATARATESHPTVSEEELLATLQGHGIRILTRELNIAPDTLVDWEILRRVDGGYKFFIELFRLWVENRKPLPKVKSELDRIVQPADELYRSAESIYRQNDHTGVQELLQQVLRINPNHVNARLLMGALFMEEDRVGEAVSILEQAFQFDEDNARYPLVRALLAQGALQESADQDDLALRSYDRSLVLSPRERNASERRSAILIKLGQRRLESGDFDGAEAAFVDAGASDQVEVVEATRRRRQIDQLKAKLDQAQDVAAAIVVVDELLLLEPENGQWKIVRANLEEQNVIQRNYSEGIGALSTGDYERAVAALAEVVHLRPDFKDAASRLSLAVNKRRAAAKAAAKPRFRWRRWLVYLAGTLTAGIAAMVAIGVWIGSTARNTSRGWEDGATVTIHEDASAPSATSAIQFDTKQHSNVLASFVPQSLLMLSGGNDGLVRLWDLNSRNVLFTRDHKSPIRVLAVSHTGDRFLTLAGDNTVRIFQIGRASPGHPVAFEMQHIALEGPLRDAALSPDGKLVAVSLPRDRVGLFSAETAQELISTHLFTDTDSTLPLSFNAQSNMLATAYVSVQFFEVPSLGDKNYLNSVDASGVAWAWSAPVIALRGFFRSNKLALWRIADTTPEQVIQTMSSITAFSFSADSRLVAVGTDNALMVFDLEKRQQVLHTNGPVISVNFSSDRSLIIAGGNDGIVRMFPL
jgi:tetratricopeptide (TPR) repeat protein